MFSSTINKQLLEANKTWIKKYSDGITASGNQLEESLICISLRTHMHACM